MRTVSLTQKDLESFLCSATFFLENELNLRPRRRDFASTSMGTPWGYSDVECLLPVHPFLHYPSSSAKISHRSNSGWRPSMLLDPVLKRAY